MPSNGLHCLQVQAANAIAASAVYHVSLAKAPEMLFYTHGSRLVSTLVTALRELSR